MAVSFLKLPFPKQKLGVSYFVCSERKCVRFYNRRLLTGIQMTLLEARKKENIQKKFKRPISRIYKLCRSYNQNQYYSTS